MTRVEQFAGEALNGLLRSTNHVHYDRLYDKAVYAAQRLDKELTEAGYPETNAWKELQENGVLDAMIAAISSGGQYKGPTAKELAQAIEESVKACLGDKEEREVVVQIPSPENLDIVKEVLVKEPAKKTAPKKTTTRKPRAKKTQAKA